MENELPPNKDDNLIIDYLIKQHERYLAHVDSLDMKIAQGVGLNGVILSFVFDKVKFSSTPLFFLIGLFLIIFSMIYGVYSYTAKVFHDSPNEQFYKDNQNVNTLKKYLIDDIEYNKKMNESKAFFFNLMLILNIIGLVLLVIGYYT